MPVKVYAGWFNALGGYNPNSKDNRRVADLDLQKIYSKVTEHQHYGTGASGQPPQEIRKNTYILWTLTHPILNHCSKYDGF